MPEARRKRCLVAIDAAGGPLLIQLELPGDATVADALAQAQAQARSAAQPSEPPGDIEWDAAVVGIWGERCERSAVPRDGDRIEVYRPLPADPRERRRRRAARR